MTSPADEIAVPGKESSRGARAEGAMETPHEALLGRPGKAHWRQSTISEPGLEARGNVFFAAIEMTRMPMILTDPRQDDNPIVFANNAFLDLTGYEADEILGRNCRFLQGAGTDRETVRQMREAIAAREALAIEVLNYRRDGSAFWNAVFIGPVFGPDGDLLYFFASQLDVTARREAETQSHQAQKMEAIGQLTAGVAHDFNNMLHVIDGSLERMESRLDQPETLRRYIAAARSAAQRGAVLTRQLLAFARRSRLEPRRVEVSTLVNAIAELLDSTAGSKATLQLHLQRRLPEVMVDPVHLETVLLNLVINARDALGGEGVITIATRQLHLDADGAGTLPPGDYLAVSVEDDGTGMAPHVKARATEPFFTTKPVGQGTGLGLAMAHGFAQQSGGRLDIRSESGEGATVTVLLPVATRGAPTTEAAPRTVQPVDRTAPPVILVVEDDAAIAAMAEETLGEVGYRVVLAASAEDGLKRVEEAERFGGFSLIFSDVVMPGGMNGVAFAQALRRKGVAAPILMTTGYNDEMALEGPQAEAMDVLGKPYRRAELIDRVQAALRKGVRTGPERRRSDFGVAEA